MVQDGSSDGSERCCDRPSDSELSEGKWKKSVSRLVASSSFPCRPQSQA